MRTSVGKVQSEAHELTAQAAELKAQLQVVQQARWGADAIARLEGQLQAVEQRLPARTALQHIPAPWNKLRGDNSGIEVKHALHAIEAAAQSLHGRTSKRRDSTTIWFSAKATWPTLARLQQDEAFMADLGSTVDNSASSLKILWRQGKLNISARKIAKIELPTAVEQPNAHMLNRSRVAVVHQECRCAQ